jgi:ribosomal protein L16 Arg81 hydroxylase
MATWRKSPKGRSARRPTTASVTPTGTSPPSRLPHLPVEKVGIDAPWLGALVAPVRLEEFLARYWLKEHLFCRGESDRFAHLLTWSVLNDILEHHWRETFRFRLARQGRDLAPASYADLDGFTPRIRARDVTEHLRRGATLSFDAIDEVHRPLTQLAEAFEAFFCAGTKINIYAGWKALHGLDLHRDNQEIFILQLDGRKRWLLYGFELEGINRDELEQESVPPAGAEFDTVLEPGDLLYIPRGCYHVAVPLNEPTLHLTLGVKNPRASDVAAWVADRLRTQPIAVRDLPCLSTAEERVRYSQELRAALLDGLDADLVAQYLRESGPRVKPRPSFSLPWSATDELLPRDGDFFLTLNVPCRELPNADGSGAADWQCGARVCRFPRSIARVIGQLPVASAVPFTHLVDGLAGQVDAGMVRMLLGMLVREHLVAVREPGVSPS